MSLCRIRFENNSFHWPSFRFLEQLKGLLCSAISSAVRTSARDFGSTIPFATLGTIVWFAAVIVVFPFITLSVVLVCKLLRN
jgi:hypothetical protein